MRLRVAVVLALMLGIVPAWTVSAQQSSFWTCPPEVRGQTLNVYNWTTYIAEDTISNFERICNVAVNYDTYAGDDEMLDELRQGNPGYDIVVPTDATVYVLIAEGLLQPLNFDHIPDFSNILDRFRNTPYDPQNRYTVPYQWGTIGIGYNRKLIGHDVTTWDELFNYTGPVAWLDEDRSMLGFALNMLKLNPNSTNPDEISMARQFLIDHSRNVSQIAPDTGQDLLAAGQVHMAIEYSGDIFQIINDCACDDFGYVIPSEGALIWIDSLAIPKGAPNKRLAEVFSDYILYPQVGADISNYTAYATPNHTAISEGLIHTEYLNNPGIYPNDDVLARLFFSTSITGFEQQYADAWDAVKRAVGH